MTGTMSRPRVSAVIPTRNRPELLRRAVMSVLRQTVEELEVVVVVDGPDAETVAMLDGIGDARVRVITLSESVGGSDARNIGAQNAAAKWVALLDDDDEWIPEKCAVQLAMAEAAGERCLVVSNFVAHSSSEGDRVLPLRPPDRDEPICEYMFSPRCGYQTSTFFCSRGLLLSIPFSSGLKGCQDLDWFLRVTAELEVRLLVCEEPLAVFHVPETRASVSRGLDWRFRLAWGKSRRGLMTARAYSLFVVQVCAVKALEEPFRWSTLATLLRECIFSGRPSVVTVGHLVALFALSAKTRQGVRALMQRVGRERATMQLSGPPTGMAEHKA